MKTTRDHKQPGICRREFLQRTGKAALIGGAVFSPSGLMQAANITPTLRPDAVSGNVLRTYGNVSLAGSVFIEQQRKIPIVGRPEVIVCG